MEQRNEVMLQRFSVSNYQENTHQHDQGYMYIF